MRKYVSPKGIGAREPHFAELKKEKLISILECLATDDLVSVHNHYCEENGYYDDEIHNMYELEEYIYGIEPMRLLYMVDGNDFRTNHAYFKADYDNLCSFEEWNAKEEIDIPSLAKWILESEDDCNCEEISNFFALGLNA